MRKPDVKDHSGVARSSTSSPAAVAAAAAMSCINASNFDAQLPAVLAAVASASFIAVDCEFSGLAPRPFLRSNNLDTLDGRWAKVRASAAAMGLLQFGVCTFTLEGGAPAPAPDPGGPAADADAPERAPAPLRLVARPFAFHLWPRSALAGVSGSADAEGDDDAAFLSSASSLSFLSTHGFDLNAVVKEGVTFLSRDAEARLRHARRGIVVRSYLREQAQAQAGAEGGDDAGGTAAPPYRPCRIVVTEGVPPAPPAAPAAFSLAATAAAAFPASASPAAAAGPEASASVSAVAAAPQPAEDTMTLWMPADVEWWRTTQAAIDAWALRVDVWARSDRWSGGPDGDGDEGMGAGGFDDLVAPSPAAESAEAAPAQRPLDVEVFPASFLGDSPSASSSLSAADLRFPYLVLPACKGFQRRVIYVYAENCFGRGASARVLVAPRDEDQVGVHDAPYWKRLRLTWVGAGSAGPAAFRRCDLRRALAEADASVDRALGFRRVIDAITARGPSVPVVGHNMWLDLAHSHAKFVGPLPPNVCDFALGLGGLFPTVVDTKTLIAAVAQTDPAASAAFGFNTALGQAFATVRGVSQVRVPKTMSVPAPAAAPAPSPEPLPALAVDAAPAGSPAAPAPATAVPADAATSLPATLASPAPAAPRPYRGRNAGFGAGFMGPAPELESVTIDWPALVAVDLAPGFAYKVGNASATALASPLLTNTMAAMAADGCAATGHCPVSDVPAAPAPAPLVAPVSDLVSAERGAAHDAGFDAFMTGALFARLTCRAAATAAAAAAATAATEAGSSAPPATDTSSSTAAAASEADLFSCERGPPALRAAVYRVFNARASDSRLRSLHLRDAATLAAQGRARAATPRAGDAVDAANSVLAARGAPVSDKTRVLVLLGLDPSVRSEEAAQLVAAGIAQQAQLRMQARPAKAADARTAAAPATALAVPVIDARRHVLWADDSTAFVTLPSERHVAAALAAAAAQLAQRANADADVPPPPVASSLAQLPASAFVPEALARLCPSPASLASLLPVSYATYLARHRDIFGLESEHEVAPREAPAPALAEAAAAVTAVTAGTKRGADQAVDAPPSVSVGIASCLSLAAIAAAAAVLLGGAGPAQAKTEAGADEASGTNEAKRAKVETTAAPS